MHRPYAGARRTVVGAFAIGIETKNETKACRLTAAVCLLAWISCMAPGQTEYDMAANAETGIEQTPLFTAGQSGYHTYRIPALTVTAKGAVLAFCEGRKDSAHDYGDIDIVLRRSEDHGRNWGPTGVIVDDDGHTCGNPSPVVDQRTGIVILVFTKNIGDTTEEMILKGNAPPRTIWVSRSPDEGMTWSKPREISEQVRRAGWRWYATGPGHAMQLSTGRIIVPSNHSLGPEKASWYSHVIYSDDGGATWSIGGIHEGFTNESTLVELSNGRLYQNMRNYFGDNRRYYATSRDGGVTWSGAKPDPALIDPICQASCLRYSTQKDGGKSRILFSNPASTERERMMVRLSYDECATWTAQKVLHEGPSAYSDLAKSRDDHVLCLYEHGSQHPYETLHLARFSLEWLTNGKDKP